MELHKPTRKTRHRWDLLDHEPALREVIIGGTERRLPRPQHTGRQRRSDSGRKKRHAGKNGNGVDQRRVRWCSETVRTCRQDKKVAKQSGLKLPRAVTVLGDGGFEGLEAGQARAMTP